jgi:hypothetical protein
MFLAGDSVIERQRLDRRGHREGNTRLTSFINRVTAQHVEWIEQLRQDILRQLTTGR